MKYDMRLTEARRLETLRYLSETPSYEASQVFLYQALPVAGSADQVAADLEWLAEQGLVTLHVVHDVRLARITQRGLDVGKGLARVPGVARPLPE